MSRERGSSHAAITRPSSSETLSRESAIGGQANGAMLTVASRLPRGVDQKIHHPRTSVRNVLTAPIAAHRTAECSLIASDVRMVQRSALRSLTIHQKVYTSN